MSHFQRTDRLAGCRRGVVAVEFALVAPFILLLMLAGTDLTILMRTKMRVDETANQVALMVTQYQNLYTSDFTVFFNASQTVAGTTPVTGVLGTTIITCIQNNNGRQTIAWQQRSPSATYASSFGTAVGAVPVMPNSYMLPSGGFLIAVEVFTPVTPWVFSASLMAASTVTSLQSYALLQPRLGSLSTITAGNRPS